MNTPGHPDSADDFVGMSGGKRLPYSAASIPRHLLSKMPVSRAYGWGRPVYAPIEGTVLEASTDEPDRERVNLIGDAVTTLVSPPSVTEDDVRPAAGNYVLIESDQAIAFLAHLRQGSVVVTEGGQVTAGALLGEVGNSGASLFPHLHLQLMSEWTTDLPAVEELLVPYRFSEYEQRVGNWLRGYSWRRVENRTPQQGERFRITPDRTRINRATMRS